MSVMVLEKLYLTDLQKVSGNLERKICAVGVAKILTETPFLLSNESNLKIW
jgi:exportin-2 (importin alpha re-exporter)